MAETRPGGPPDVAHPRSARRGIEVETHAGVLDDLRRTAAGGCAAILHRLESKTRPRQLPTVGCDTQSVAGRLGRLHAASTHHAGNRSDQWRRARRKTMETHIRPAHSPPRGLRHEAPR